MASETTPRWSSAGVRRDGQQSVVTNMDLAIYCHMLHLLNAEKLPLVEVRKIDRGRHEMVFNDPDGVVSKLEMEFVNGGGHGEAAYWCRAFAMAQRGLKCVMREEQDGNARSSERRAVHPGQPDPAARLPQRRFSR